jgi:hypothetical protein
MIDQENRRIFIDYLYKLIEGENFSSYSEDWQNIIIEHYQDDQLESIRRNIVRMRIKAGDPKIFPINNEQMEQLKKFAKELQKSES